MNEKLTHISGHNTLYALSTCIHCRNAQKLLKEKDIPFDPIFVDLLEGADREQVIEDLVKINPKLSFPTMLSKDGTILVGINNENLKEVFGK
jgi:glutaredoxin-like protein NrdH